MLMCRRSSSGVQTVCLRCGFRFCLPKTFVLGGQTTQWRCASRGSLPRAQCNQPPAAPLMQRACWSPSRNVQPRDGTAPNWPGANGRPLRGCRSRARQVSRRASTIAHGIRSSSCKLRRAAPHIALESADARLRSGEAGFLECSKPGRVRQRNQRCGSTFCRWLSPAWC